MTTPTEETPLEHALRIAADEPASRPDFYRLLIESEVFIIGGTLTADTSGGRRTPMTPKRGSRST